MKGKRSNQGQPAAPFGVATKRFTCIGYHPGLNSASVYRTQIGPVTYDPDTARHAYDVKITKESWTRALDSEDFSQNLGHRNESIMKYRRFMKGGLGPGIHDLPESTLHKVSFNAFKNVTFGFRDRFKIFEYLNPAPGTYGNPYVKMEKERVKNKKDRKPNFEWDGLKPRFKCVPPGLPPNIYRRKDPEDVANKLTNKIVSKRGPYDLFTGLRDGSTIKNHFGPGGFKGSNTMFYDTPNESDRMFTRSKKNYGKFLKGQRFPKKTSVRSMLNDLSLCWKDPSAPGPTTYDPLIPSKVSFEESKYPFNNSLVDPRPQPKRPLIPGAGRYSVCKKKQMNQHKTWQFLSKIQRGFKTPESYSF